MSILAEVLKGLPVIAVMWYMLKDLKSSVATITKTLQTMNDEIVKLKIDSAANSSPLKIKHLEDRIKEDRDSYRHEFDEVKKKQGLIDSQLTKIWTLIGDRPEDVRRRLQGE